MCLLLVPHFLLFLLQPLTVLIRQTRQAVFAINQSISFLDVYALTSVLAEVDFLP
jgi:hypothetical protein